MCVGVYEYVYVCVNNYKNLLLSWRGKKWFNLKAGDREQQVDGNSDKGPCDTPILQEINKLVGAFCAAGYPLSCFPLGKDQLNLAND